MSVLRHRKCVRTELYWRGAEMSALSATGKCKFWGDQGCHNVVRAHPSHQCGPGANPGVDVICGLSLLLVVSFALK